MFEVNSLSINRSALLEDVNALENEIREIKKKLREPHTFQSAGHMVELIYLRQRATIYYTVLSAINKCIHNSKMHETREQQLVFLAQPWVLDKWKKFQRTAEEVAELQRQREERLKDTGLIEKLRKVVLG